MRSLKRALLAYILCGVTLVVCIAGFAVFLVASANLRAQFDATLIDRAETFGSLVIDEDGELEFEYDQPLDEAQLGTLLRITADDGSVIARSPGWPVDATAPAAAAGAAARLRSIEVAEGPARYIALTRFAARDPGEVDAGESITSDRVIVVEVIARSDNVQRAESAVLAALIVGGLFAIIGSTVAVWLGVRRGLVPVRELSAAVEAIETDDLMLLPPDAPYPQELRPIALAIENLLERLRAAIQRERRFTDAAAHELRTPIAELKTITDVANRWPEPDRLQRSIHDARIVVRQMEDLLESLLAAARGTVEECRQPAEPIALLQAARSASKDATDRLKRPDLSWSFEGAEDASIRGPRGVIVAIIRNLIENATEYTAGEGCVHVRALRNGAATMLEIENGPVSLDPAQAAHLGEPFWRADESRSNRNHRGLGLTIVESLADALQVDHEIAMTPQQHLRVRLTAKQDSARGT